MNKKKLLSLAVVVIMIAILSMSTLAWFSDSESIKNDFMIADSEHDTADKIFSVDVWENTPDGDQNQDGYTYKDILPGDVLKKEAVVENTGYYDQYIRVTVTVSDAKAWMEVLGSVKAPGLDQIVNGWDDEYLWVLDSAVVDEANDAIVYTMYYNHILQGDITNDNDYLADTAVVFTAVKIPASMTAEQAAAFQNNFNITVKADAVQTENLGIDPTAADAAAQAFAVVEG